ncbi:MAG TPA: oligopeptide/dipeptide ABC transporter ATP-binding protein [Verrucomicrobiae bacterium]|nr:oligopeptide/dipeptide ABC transporter ATP-binding protein [Verrucomicrobiae bacterium]
MPYQEVLLSAREVAKDFPLRGGLGGRRGMIHAVRGVSLEVRRGETLGIVGESGCGKSTLGRCLVRLMDLTSGSVHFDGVDITRLSRRQLRPYRARMQLIFQDPYASLNPRRRVGGIVAEPILIQGTASGAAIRRRVRELFEVVGLDPSYVDRYPHEFSGGQRQRIGIARALALNPELIVADEPVSALDVSIQAQVLNLMADLQERFGLTYVFIAHDLGVVQHVSDRVGVMYLGDLVELAGAASLYQAPLHPYTEALLSVVPEVDDDPTATPRQRIVLRGDVPNPMDMPTGCAFHPRCPVAQDRCREERPLLAEASPGRLVACHFPQNLAAARALGADRGGVPPAPAPPA